MPRLFAAVADITPQQATLWETGTMPNTDLPTSETALRERQDSLVRALAVEQNTARLQSLSDELEAVQRRLEQVRNA
ncbi:hypothetical protein [Arthrobacter sedimenti]|nr:hypothetical protein [Arthrobacter sedimenti]OUM41177.1 hypothetical protein B8W73_12630 [Arthrobacter agilis]